MRHRDLLSCGVRRLGAGLFALWLMAGCTDLPTIQNNNLCGNGVLEPTAGEDCEPGKILPDGLICGDDSEELGCRFICSDDDGQGLDLAPCPAGWGCSIQGFCQPPSGSFFEPRPIPGITTPLAIGDFDGNGFPDLAAVQEPLLSVAFGNAGTDYPVTLRAPIDSSPSPPVVGDIEGDGLSDLAVHAGSRINIFTGVADQTLSPFMVPAFGVEQPPDEALMAVVTMNEPLQRQQVMALEYDEDDDAMYVYALTTSNDDPTVFEIDVPGNRLQANVGSADLIGLDDVHEIAVAPHRGDAVFLLSMVCELRGDPVSPDFDPECAAREAGVVPAPRGWQLSDAGTFVADVNGDALSDLVFGVQSPQGLGVAAALGDGFELGEAFVLPVPAPSMMGGPMMPGAQMMAPPSWLLGVADITMNGLADIITAQGIIEAEATGLDQPITYTERYRTTRTWDELRIADLNRDGMPDMVATNGPSILTLLNVGSGIFNQSEVTVESDRLSIHLGDFDGDLFIDLLAVVDGRLLTGFNDGRGLTRDLTEVVSLPGNLDVGVFRSASGSADAIDDVLLIVEELDFAFGLILEGSGARRLAAPLQLPSDVDSLIVVSHPDEASFFLIIENTEDLGRVMRRANADFLQNVLFDDPPLVEQQGDCLPDIPVPLETTTYVPSGQPGYERIVTVQSQSMDDIGMMSLDIQAIPRVLIAQADGPVVCTALAPSPLSTNPEKVAVADVNRDGLLDIIIGHPSVRMPGDDGAAVEGGLAIYWGEGDDRFATEPVTVVRQGNERGNGSLPRFRGVFAPIDTDTRPGVELAMIMDDGLYLLSYDLQLGDFGDPVRLDDPRLDPPDIEALEVFDANLDGVQDLLVSGPRQSVLMRQKPCTAIEAAEDECTRTIEAPEAN